MKDGNVYFFHGTFENGGYKGVRKHTSFLETCWCMVYGMAYVYGRAIFNGLDWFGQKLVDLIDHSDFFAGAVWTLAIMSMWEMLAKK